MQLISEIEWVEDVKTDNKDKGQLQSHRLMCKKLIGLFYTAARLSGHPFVLFLFAVFFETSSRHKLWNKEKKQITYGDDKQNCCSLLLSSFFTSPFQALLFCACC